VHDASTSQGCHKKSLFCVFSFTTLPSQEIASRAFGFNPHLFFMIIVSIFFQSPQKRLSFDIFLDKVVENSVPYEPFYKTPIRVYSGRPFLGAAIRQGGPHPNEIFSETSKMMAHSLQ
jgi:hypothetical protein